MHERKLIFRDLYPKRLHLRDGLIKWSVLGMPYNFKKLNKCPTFSGHLIYSAPEILESGKNNFLSDKADVWSLGACLYFIVTKKEPFSDEYTLNNPMQVKKNIRGNLLEEPHRVGLDGEGKPRHHIVNRLL